MSYDITFKVKAEGIDYYIPVGDCDANITWNVREIITRSTGLEWKNEANSGLCKDIIPLIEIGCDRLRCNPEKYKQYEASNGWGTVRGTIEFFERIIKCWYDFREECCTWGKKELVDITTFWIE